MSARWILVACLLASSLHAEEAVVASDGRFVLPSHAVAVEVRVADGAPVAAERRTLKQPGVLAPAAEWRTAAGVTVRLDLCIVPRAVGLGEVMLLAARLRLTNPTERPQSTSVVVALLPEREVWALAFERHAFFVEGQPVLVADAPSRGAILAESPLAPRPLAPQATAHVVSAAGQCRGEMFFDVALAAGQAQTLGWLCPSGASVSLDFCRALVVEELFAQAAKEASAAR